MTAGFCPLASGSKGNATYFSSGQTKLLIDCGLSCKILEERLGALGVTLDQIDAILISHEHLDHIGGLKTVAKRYNIPVLANSETAQGIYAALNENFAFKIFTTTEPFTVGNVEIMPFSILHDTSDPVAFTLKTKINDERVKVGICTDLGFVTPLVKRSLQECDFLIVEANHEISMVHASARPKVYKERVLSRSGHLSNEACAELLFSLLHPNLRHIHLAHLSEECNNSATALNRVIVKIGNSIPLTVALQESASPFIEFATFGAVAC